MPGGYRGKQGRKPTASTIVERQRQRQQQGMEPQSRRFPVAPSHLTQVAKAEWRRMGKLLRDAGLLTNVDTTALALYCSAHARLVEAEAMLQGPPGQCPNCDSRLQREGDGDPFVSGMVAGYPACRRPHHALPEYGMVIKNSKGKTTPSPYAAMANQAMAQMLRLLGEFGMTPASRSRIPREQGIERRQRPAPAAVQPGEAQPDPREALSWPVQVGKN